MLAISHPQREGPSSSTSNAARTESYECSPSSHGLVLSRIMPHLSISHSPAVDPFTTPHHEPRPARPTRPTLKVNTQGLSQTTTISKSAASSLRLETLSAVSPTVRNTFQNAHEAATLDNATRASRPKLFLNVDVGTSQPQAEISSLALDTLTPLSSSGSVDSSTSTDSSISNASSIITVPYRTSFTLKSILRNSPLPRTTRTPVQHRPIFPPAKRLCFRQPLEEIIVTTKYVVADYDLDLSTITPAGIASRAQDPSASRAAHADEAADPAVAAAAGRRSPTARNARLGDKRESDSDSDGDDYAATPVAGRRKKRRDWTWTLGPVGVEAGSAASARATAAVMSEGVVMN